MRLVPASAAQYAHAIAGPMMLPGNIANAVLARRTAGGSSQKAASAVSKSSSTFPKARSTVCRGHSPSCSAARARARTAESGSCHSRAPRTSAVHRRPALVSESSMMAQQAIDCDAAAFRRRAGSAAHEYKSPAFVARTVGRQHRRYRTPIAQVDELQQAGAFAQRLGIHGVDDEMACPMRADLHLEARRAPGKIIRQVRVVPLASQLAHAVFRQAVR